MELSLPQNGLKLTVVYLNLKWIQVNAIMAFKLHASDFMGKDQFETVY